MEVRFAITVTVVSLDRRGLETISVLSAISTYIVPFYRSVYNMGEE